MSRRWRRLASLAALAAGLVIGGLPAASALVRTEETPRPLGPVGVIGDSLTYAYLNELPGLFAEQGFGPIRADGLSSRHIELTSATIPSGQEALRAARAAGFDSPLWVIALGTNDLGFDATTMERQIERMLDAIGTDRRTVWVNVWASKYPTSSTRFNDALARVATRRPELTVADWASVLQQHPEWFASDGVHNTLAGAKARNRFLVDAAAAAVASRRVEAAPVALTPDGSVSGFVAQVPVRALDTRDPGGQRLRAGQDRRVVLDGVVPDDATTASVTLTAIGTAPGWVAAWRCGDPFPPTSAVNHPAAAPRAALAAVGLDSGRGFCVRSLVDTDLVVDVTGSFRASGGARFLPATPARLLDTREAPRAARLAAGEVLRVATGQAGATGVSLNLTLAESDGGWLRAWPCDAASEPFVSNVNARSGEIVANAAWLGLGPSGDVCLKANTATHVVVDLVGAFGEQGGLYQPVRPARLLDTRNGTGGWFGRAAAGQAIDLATGGAPAGTVGLALTLTVTEPMASGWAAVVGCPPPAGLTSTLNFTRGAVVSNLSAAAAAPCVTQMTATHLVADVAGVFIAGP
jgi:hypothetical protein